MPASRKNRRQKQAIDRGVEIFFAKGFQALDLFYDKLAHSSQQQAWKPGGQETGKILDTDPPASPERLAMAGR